MTDLTTVLFTAGTVTLDASNNRHLIFTAQAGGVGGIVPGDTFYAGTGQGLIASVEDGNNATLALAWTGGPLVAATYAVQLNSPLRNSPLENNTLIRQEIAKITSGAIFYLVPSNLSAPDSTVAPNPKPGQWALDPATLPWRLWAFDGLAWVRQSGTAGANSLAISAAGPLSGRSAFDSRAPGFAYFANDTQLMYIRLDAGGWSTGSTFAGPQGIKGDQGNQGYAPVLSMISDGVRRVLQVTDWIGGVGAKPATGKYLGATGMVDGIGDAIDIRGPQGIKGETGNQGQGIQPNDSGTLAGRAAHNGEAKGYVYLRTDVTPNVIYVKLSATSGDWSTGSPIGGAGDMAKADNLSGLASQSAARANLGLGDLATKNQSDLIDPFAAAIVMGG